MENHSLPSISLNPRLGIRVMALWLGGREEVSLVSLVTQGKGVGIRGLLEEAPLKPTLLIHVATSARGAVSDIQ